MAAAASYATLQQVLAQVWPSAFYATTNGALVLNTSFISAADEVGSSPQKVVYDINPRAVWSDGVPITYRDFVYNWQAQSGKAGFHDVGGEAFEPVDDAGYDDISDVSGSPTDPYTVTVTFSSPYRGWRSLFSYLMPAHVGRADGFDSGFTDPVADLVSGGPYLVAEPQPGYSLELVRNARYWGVPGDLATITYYFTSSTTELVSALSAGELDVAQLVVAADEYRQLKSTAGLSVRPVAGAGYWDLDFNEAGGVLRSPVLREAVMMSVDRATMASSVLGPFGLPATPVESRAMLPGAPGYAAGGAIYDRPEPSKALALLDASGYKTSGGILESPSGTPVELSLAVNPSDPLAEGMAQQVAGSCASIGIKVQVVAEGPSRVPPAGWQMAIERRQVPADPARIVGRYRAGGAADVDGYSSAAMDAVLAQIATAPASSLTALYDAVDARAWDDFVDLPLVQVPVTVVTSSGFADVSVGPYEANIAWDEQDWGFPAS